MHPTLPYLLSSSDDMLIKLWDWDKGWMCTQIFEGHSHYVMQVLRPPGAAPQPSPAPPRCGFGVSFVPVRSYLPL